MSKHKAQQFQAHNAKYQNPPIAASSIISRSHWFHISIIPSCIQYSSSTGNQSLLYSICLPRPSMLVSAPLPPPPLPPTPAHCAHRRFLRSPRKEHEQGVEDQKYQELREKTEYDARDTKQECGVEGGGRGIMGHVSQNLGRVGRTCSIKFYLTGVIQARRLRTLWYTLMLWSHASASERVLPKACAMYRP